MTEMILAEGLSLTLIPEHWSHSNAYFLQGKKGLLIDPGFASDVSYKDRVDALLITHGHHDHMGGLLSWLEDKPRPFYITKGDKPFLNDPEANASKLLARPTVYPEATRYLGEGDRLDIDAHYALKVVLSPGHTPGSACFLLEDKEEKVYAIFTGDTLFADSIGRCDLKGGSPAQMRESLRKLRKLLLSLDQSLPIFFGHGPASTVETLLNKNPYLQEKAIF